MATPATTTVEAATETLAALSLVADAPHTKALIIPGKGSYALTSAWSKPQIHAPDEVRIKVAAVGLNPIDWKSVEFGFCLPGFPWTIGREAAGVVESVGCAVKTLKAGDKVWTSTYYRDARAGCFQEYIVVPAHTVLPLPSSLSFSEGACLGVAALTATLTLYHFLGLPLPSTFSPPPSAFARDVSPPTPPYSRSPTPPPALRRSTEHRRDAILIWGGSTITGQFLTQLASSTLDVIAVVSSTTALLARALGAAHVITRTGKTDKEIVDAVRAVGGDRIKYAVDLVGSATAALALQTLSSEGAQIAPLAMWSAKTEVPAGVEVRTVEMKRFVLDAGNRVYAEEVNRLVEKGALRLPAIEVLEGGLEAVRGGLEVLKRGDMGGRKLVAIF